MSKRNLKIISLIGEGLNANVYKITKYQPSIKISKVFALKVLKRSEDINHFKTEFESLLKANGKHIVKYRGWETYKSKPALLLEYINGVTLHTLLNQHSLTYDETAWIYQETAAGLIELDESGLFHGDLSPRNIMIDVNGSVKLIDFGLTHWRTQKIELTPEFAAHSVLNGETPSLQSDLTSLDRIFKQFNLQKSHIKCEKPLGLSQKISSIQNQSSYQTEEVQNPLQKRWAYETRSFRSSIFALTCCFFISPVTAQNNSSIEHNLIVRSSDWLAVKSSSGSEWCFTPCSLKFKQTGLQTIHWKNNSVTQKTRVYIDKNQKFLTIN